MQASDNLRINKKRILSIWEREVNRMLTPAILESSKSIRNSLPEFLDGVANALVFGIEETATDILKFAYKHGAERANFTHYTLEDALEEYNILRKIIFQELEEHIPLSSRDRDIILESINIALKKTGIEFTRSELLKIQEARDETHRLLMDKLKIEERFNFAIEATKFGLWEFNHDTNEIYLNTYQANLFELPPDKEKYPLEAFTPKLHPEDKDRVMKMAETRKDYFNIEFRLLLSGGKIRWISSHGKTVKDKNGLPIKHIGIDRDITKQKQFEKDLEEVATKMRLITDIQPNLISYMDREFRYRFVNDSYLKLTGKKRKDILNRFPWEVIGQKAWDDMRPYMEKALSGEEVSFEKEIHFLQSTRYMKIFFKPFFSRSLEVEGVFISEFDLTEKMKTLEDLRIEQSMKERFIYTLSHDLRTPLTAAKMAAQLTQKKSNDSEFVHLQLSRVIRNIDRTDNMIQDLLDASRLKAGQVIQPHLEKFNIYNFVTQVIEELKIIYGNRFVLKSLQEFEIISWPQAISRILENLCSNAVKYGTPDKEIEVSIRQLDDMFSLSVHNFGKPLEQELDVFEDFTRSLAAEKSNKKGWGIGLTIVKGLSESVGGEVEIHRHKNGTTFRVILPKDSTDKIPTHLFNEKRHH